MPIAGQYGIAPPELAPTPPGAIQFSPLMPGSSSLDEQAPGSLASFTMLAPPGTIERRYTLALALRALAKGTSLVALAPKDKGGSRLASELEQLGCEVQEEGRSHHRICTVNRPELQESWAEAIAEGAPRQDQALQLWTQPGVFSWNKADPGSALLRERLGALSGFGADLGSGIGLLSQKALESRKVKRLTLVEVDRRAIDCARKNLGNSRCDFLWADLRSSPLKPGSFDFVIMNPPFHDSGVENQELGLEFLRQSASALREGGTAWIVANRHLPYEQTLHDLFSSVSLLEEKNGFKVYEAHK